MQINTDGILHMLSRIPGFEGNALRGCSSIEIEQILESQQLAEPPLAYKCFLEIAGRNKSSFLLGTDMCYPLLTQFKKDAGELVSESSLELELPSDAFVFAFHQGYSMVFFRRIGDAIENVYSYTEGDDRFEDLKKSFLEWFQDTINEHLREGLPTSS